MRKGLLAILVICTAASSYLAAADSHPSHKQTALTGRWKAVFVGKENIRPKMFSEVVFDIVVNEDKITGTATMANWPGVAPISDGILKGDQVSLTSIGKIISSSGYPKMIFNGVIQGEVMKLTMTWSYVGGNDATSPKWEMEATRIPK